MTEAFSAEVVTRSLVRLVSVPGQVKPAALITLDNGLDHNKPNSFGPAGVAALDAALDQAFAADPAFVAITGKPYVFLAGADVTGMALIRNREQGLAIGQLGHRVFRRLKDSTVPTFAFINGVTLGGGLELALHCHYRTVSAGAGALGLPEVSLGLIPGWGGSQLLPNLIGIVGAARVIVQNPLTQKTLGPDEAREMGVADVLFEPADFLERSLEWAGSVVSGQVTVERPQVDRSNMWEAVLGYARQQLDEKLHAAAPAPYRALELLALAKTAPFAEGTAAEDEALADMLLSEEQRASLYAFDLVQRRAKRPAGAPDPALARPVTKVGIVGAGLMASQLAALFVRRLEVPVVLTDLDQERVDKGVAWVHGEIDKLASKGRLPAGKAAKLRGLVSGSVDKQVFADADWVIEAVFEDLVVKKRVWAELEEIVSPECVLASNTSSLSITAMSEELRHPERVVGFHFFNPVAMMPLVEVVRGAKTDDAALATAFAVGKKLKKSCVLVKDAPAFVVNRLLTRLLSEVLTAVDAGTPLDVADTALDPLGLPIRPLPLLTLVGAPVALHVCETLHKAFPERFQVSANLARIAASSKSLTDRDGGIDPSVAAMLEVGDAPLSAEELRDRTLTALAEEARLMLDEGVVGQPHDLDLCMIIGAGWPSHLGGITPYLDRSGMSEKVTGRRFLPRGVASLPE